MQVNVINLNDNSPVFSSSHYDVAVNENSPKGSHVVTVSAKDLDSEDYGKVTYSLTGENSENFIISSDTGEIIVGNEEFLDHEVLNETTIQVVATDGAPEDIRRSASVPIRIQILDINDNKPIFNQSVYNASVVENVRSNPPVPILQVHASDNDAGINGNIHYKILSGNENGKCLKILSKNLINP